MTVSIGYAYQPSHAMHILDKNNWEDNVNSRPQKLGRSTWSILFRNEIGV